MFIIWGALETKELGLAESYEKFILGFILFIPGSYHSFIAAMALLGHEGYGYENLTTFEGDSYFHDDWFNQQN